MSSVSSLLAPVDDGSFVPYATETFSGLVGMPSNCVLMRSYSAISLGVKPVDSKGVTASRRPTTWFRPVRVEQAELPRYALRMSGPQYSLPGDPGGGTKGALPLSGP